MLLQQFLNTDNEAIEVSNTEDLELWGINELLTSTDDYRYHHQLMLKLSECKNLQRLSLQEAIDENLLIMMIQAIRQENQRPLSITLTKHIDNDLAAWQTVIEQARDYDIINVTLVGNTVSFDDLLQTNKMVLMQPHIQYCHIDPWSGANSAIHMASPDRYEHCGLTFRNAKNKNHLSWELVNYEPEHLHLKTRKIPAVCDALTIHESHLADGDLHNILSQPKVLALESLSLNNCQLHTIHVDHIVAFIKNKTNDMVVLNLEHNSLVYEDLVKIIEACGQLNNIKHLYLAHNQLLTDDEEYDLLKRLSKQSIQHISLPNTNVPYHHSQMMLFHARLDKLKYYEDQYLINHPNFRTEEGSRDTILTAYPTLQNARSLREASEILERNGLPSLEQNAAPVYGTTFYFS